MHVITGTRLVGVLLHAALAAETAASGDTTGASSVDNGASSAGGLTADLHVSDLTLGGYTNVTVKVKHSVDDVTYTDLITTFANITVPGAQRVTVAGTVNRHLAVSWAFNGAGSGQSITFAVAASRG
jgi:methenyltetrahydromethanopterin cyclohydrolase